MLRKNDEVMVCGIRQLTPRVREYLLSTLNGQPLPAAPPGSHIELHTSSPLDGPLVRHYSLIGGIGSWDDHPNNYRIAVQREDRARGSAYIHDSFAIGTRLQISAPKNNFQLDRRDRKSLLIAGGIGVTPILSMLRSLARRGREYEVFYAGRSLAEMAYRQDIQRLAGTRATLHVSDSNGTNRPDLHTLLSSQPDGTTVYVCGPAAMVSATQQTAAALKWDPRRVRSELFSAGPTGAEVAFEVVLKRSDRRIHVGRDTSILDALIAAGVAPLSDCRRGECGLCPLTVLAADGPLQHRDRYLSAQEQAAGDTLCICVSRLQGSTLILDA